MIDFPMALPETSQGFDKFKQYRIGGNPLRSGTDLIFSTNTETLERFSEADFFMPDQKMREHIMGIIQPLYDDLNSVIAEAIRMDTRITNENSPHNVMKEVMIDENKLLTRLNNNKNTTKCIESIGYQLSNKDDVMIESDNNDRLFHPVKDVPLVKYFRFFKGVLAACKGNPTAQQAKYIHKLANTPQGKDLLKKISDTNKVDKTHYQKLVNYQANIKPAVDSFTFTKQDITEIMESEAAKVAAGLVKTAGGEIEKKVENIKYYSWQIINFAIDILEKDAVGGAVDLLELIDDHTLRLKDKALEKCKEGINYLTDEEYQKARAEIITTYENLIKFFKVRNSDFSDFLTKIMANVATSLDTMLCEPHQLSSISNKKGSAMILAQAVHGSVIEIPIIKKI